VLILVGTQRKQALDLALVATYGCDRKWMLRPIGRRVYVHFWSNKAPLVKVPTA
jgi:hypothetical protein